MKARPRKFLARWCAAMYYRLAGPMAPANPEDGHVQLEFVGHGVILRGRNGSVRLDVKQCDDFASELAYAGGATFVVNDGVVSR